MKPWPSTTEGRSPSSLAYEAHIDGLRAVAVVAVILFHAFPELLPGGFVGVDVFFVISGYLITRILLHEMKSKTFSFRLFYFRRVRRIFPALIVVMAASLAFGWLILLPDEWAQLGNHTAAAASFVSNFVFMGEVGYFDAPSRAKPFLHLWSLAIEEQFYLLWPLLLLVSVLLQRRGNYLLVAVLFFSFFSVFLLSAGKVAFFSTATRVWELALGGLLAWHTAFQPHALLGRSLQHHRRSWPRIAPVLAVAGLLAIFAACLLLSDGTAYPGLAALLPTVGAACVIIGGQLPGPARTILCVPMIVGMGLISYPLYLWHWPLFSFAEILEGHESAPSLRVALVMATIALAVATHRLVEIPARRMKPAGAVAAIYAIAVLGILGHYSAIDRITSYAAGSSEMKIVTEARRDWSFPPEGFAPFGFGDSVFWRFGGPGPKTVFIGDSNMLQYAARVGAVAASNGNAQRGVIFAADDGCLPVEGVIRESKPTCSRFVADAYDVAGGPDVATVVIGAQWHGYFSHEDDYYFVSSDGSRHPLGDEHDTKTSERVLASLTTSLARLQREGKEVVLLANSPVGRAMDPISSLQRPVIGRYLPKAPVDVSRADIERKLEVVTLRLKKVADATGATFVDPVVHFCSLTSCSKFDDDGAPRYMDSAHFRTSYIRRHATFLDRFIMGPTN